MGLNPMGFVATDYATLIWGLDPLDDPKPLFSRENLVETMEAWLADNAVMKRTFKGSAIIAGLIDRNQPGGKRKTGRQATFSTDILYDTLRKYDPDHIMLRITRAEAMRDPARFAETRHASVNRPALERIRVEARRLERAVQSGQTRKLDSSEMAALAYPDRIGLRRKGDAPRYQLSGGKGAVMDDGDALAGARLIVATDLDGNPREARIMQAIRITESAVRELFEDRIVWEQTCIWSKRERRVVARQQERFGAIALDDRLWKNAPQDAIAKAMLDGVRDLGLHMAMSDAVRRFIARVRLAKAAGIDLPDMDDQALLDGLEDWLLPHLTRVRTADDWKRFDLLAALRAMLSWNDMQALDAAVPGTFITPLGREIPIDYSGEHPEIALRLQEMFGQKTHPMVGNTPLRVTLLSPAQRPVQTTLDLPGFWSGSYADVRKDMRAAYPKHPWPEDPTEADPTLRAKRRKG